MTNRAELPEVRELDSRELDGYFAQLSHREVDMQESAWDLLLATVGEHCALTQYRDFELASDAGKPCIPPFHRLAQVLREYPGIAVEMQKRVLNHLFGDGYGVGLDDSSAGTSERVARRQERKAALMLDLCKKLRWADTRKPADGGGRVGEFDLLTNMPEAEQEAAFAEYFDFLSAMCLKELATQYRSTAAAAATTATSATIRDELGDVR